MSKRLSKDQLESDVLVTLYARTSMYFKQHTTRIITISVAVLLIIGSSVGYYFYNQNQQQAAQAFLGYAETHFSRGDFETALFGSDAILGIGLEAIVASYGRTTAGNLARYYAAVAEHELGNSDAALGYMEGFRPPRGILGVSTIAFHAVLLDDNGKHAEAARKFRKAAHWDVNDGTTPQNLLRGAQSAIAASDYRLAGELVDEILNKYSSSNEVTHARRIAGMVAAR